jgi:hypothetical protein
MRGVQWFAPHSINDGFFQHPGLGVPEQARLQYTGKITCATSFGTHIYPKFL